MNYYYPIFGLFLIFVAWQAYERNKSTKQSKAASDDFWTRESEANSIRKANLDNENYITLTDDMLIENLWPDYAVDEELSRCSEILKTLMNKRILNLAGMTTTDIKLKYGVANLNELSTYDDNYTLMVQTLAAYGTRLMNLQNKEAAIKIFEFGIDSLTEISTNYKHLATLYTEKNQPEKIDHLIEIAGSLNSLMKPSIIRSLEEIKQK
jgi:hypothetical protein